MNAFNEDFELKASAALIKLMRFNSTLINSFKIKSDKLKTARNQFPFTDTLVKVLML